MQGLFNSLASPIFLRTKLDVGPLSLLSRIRASPTLHRLWYGETTEDERSYNDAKSKVLPKCFGMILVFFNQETFSESAYEVA